jgi:hypothetical protein
VIGMKIEFIKKDVDTVLPGAEPFVVNTQFAVIAKISVNGKPAMALVNMIQPGELAMYKFRDRNFQKPSAFYKEINRLIVNEGFRISAFSKVFEPAVEE